MFTAREALYNIAEQSPKEEQNSLMKVLMAEFNKYKDFNKEHDLHLKYTTAFFVAKMASRVESNKEVVEAVNILMSLRQDANPNIVTASEKAIVDFVVECSALYKIQILYAIAGYIKQKGTVNLGIESVVSEWISKYAEIYDAGNIEAIKHCQNDPSWNSKLAVLNFTCIDKAVAPMFNCFITTNPEKLVYDRNYNYKPDIDACAQERDYVAAYKECLVPNCHVAQHTNYTEQVNDVTDPDL